MSTSKGQKRPHTGVVCRREIAPYEVANARAKALLEELYAERLNKTPKVQPVNKPAEPLITGLGRAARRFLAFCETLGRTTRGMLQ